VLQSPRPTYLADEHQESDEIAKEQEQKRFLESNQLQHSAADFFQRQHLVRTKVHDPVVNDAGLEQRAEHGVYGFGQVRTAIEHELGGVRAQQAPGQKPYGYFHLDASGLRYRKVVHETLNLE